MKRVWLIIIVVVCFCNSQAQNVVYDANAEVRKVAEFNSINVSGSVALYVSQGAETGIAVSANDENYNSKIKTDVKNGTLYISVDGGMWNGFSLANRKLKAYVSIVNLRQLHVSGASNVVLMDKISAEELTMVVLGASQVIGPLQLKSLHLNISGASVVRFSGYAETATISANGAAKVTGFELQVGKGKLDVSGASQITISVSKELDANASAGSRIYYRGDASVKSVNTSSGATVQKRVLP